MNEKRQFQRAPLTVAVEAAAGGRTLQFESRNVSVGGMLLHGEDTLNENDTFRMKFRLPGRPEEISVTGIVQHVTDAFMGVRFAELPDPMQEAIEAYVRQALPSKTRK